MSNLERSIFLRRYAISVHTSVDRVLRLVMVRRSGATTVLDANFDIWLMPRQAMSTSRLYVEKHWAIVGTRALADASV